MAKVAIIGSGAWGTALGNILLENKHEVFVWGIDNNELSDLRKGFNTRYFGQQKLVCAPHLVTNNLNDIFAKNPDFFLIAIPTVVINEVINNIVALAPKNKQYYFINVAKGLDPLTKKPWSFTFKKLLKNKMKQFVTLIGPSFAIDVFKGETTVVNSVSTNKNAARIVSLLFNNHHFKCIEIDDEVGAELVGALKNIMAIALGIAYQLHLSINTRAAMLAQATKEIGRIIKSFGGDPNTISQFCGVGDIYLTCTDEKSRNFSFGKEIASKGVLATLQANNNKTIEGYNTAKILYDYIKKQKNLLPVFSELCSVLFEKQQCNTFVSNIIKKIID